VQVACQTIKTGQKKHYLFIYTKIFNEYFTFFNQRLLFY